MHKIFDAQSHCMPPEIAQNTAFFKQGWSDIDRQLDVMKKHGIERALLLYPTSDAHIQMGGWKNVCGIYNQKIGTIVKKYNPHFIGAGIIPVDDPAAIDATLASFKELGLRAISLASSYDGKYLDDEIFHPAYQFAQENNMPIHIHPQIIKPIGEERVRDPLLSPVLEYVFDVSMSLGKMMMEGIFTKYPDVKFMFAHYGGVLPFVKERFDNTYRMLRKRNFVKDLGQNPSRFFENLYFDTSGSKSPAQLRCMLEVVDSDHILWASDYPANQDMEASIRFLDECGLETSQQQQILFKNAAGLFT